MTHGLLVTVHLLCATVFIGVVAFEVLIFEGLRIHLPARYMLLMEEGIHHRARKIMPWFVALLYLSGLTLTVTAYGQVLREALARPFTSLFGTLLGLKILLALSVLVHFALAMKHSICGSMTSRRFKYTHLSVSLHMVLIVLLAKGMFYLHR